jgi:two-component system, OmpR family, clock-associated histidine kinase SasA
MNWIYDLAPLIGLGISLVLVFFILRQSSRRQLNRVFAIFLISMGLWAFCVFEMRQSPTLAQAIPWEKASFICLSIVSVTFFHFVKLFIGQTRSSWQIPLAYFGVFLVILTWPTDLLLSGMKEMWYGHGFEGGILFYPFMVLCYGIVIVAFISLIRAHRKLGSAIEKRRYVYIEAGAVCCVLGLLGDVLAARGIHIYPLGIFGNIMFSLLCAYAMLRYHLMDITVIIRKGTAYILVSALGIGVYMGLLIIAYVFISGAWSLPLWLNIVFILIFAVGLQPLLRWAQNTVDRWFYRGRHDYLNDLERLAEETGAITELDNIANSLVNTITRAMLCTNVAVLLPDTDNKYFVSAVRKTGQIPAKLRLPRDGVLIWYLSQYKGILIHQDISILPQLKALTDQENSMLNELDAELFIPLLTRDGLRGVLILGKKRSETDYSQEEIRLLRVVASQMATTVENARLFDMQLRRYQEQALLARISMTIASELDFSKVFDSLMKEIKDMLPLDYGAMMLVTESEQKAAEILEFKANSDYKPEPGIYVFSAENLTQIDEVKYEPDLEMGSLQPDRAPLISAGLKSLLYLPLKSKDKLTGCLALASREKDAYNDEHIRLLKQVAVQMAIAYEKSRLYELERRMRLELEQQDKERTEFINSLIHEIKTPITAMLASCDLLSEELANSPGILGELAANLSAAINNLNRRVSELTDFAKLQNTDIIVDLQVVDMHRLVARADSLVSGLLQSRNQMLNCELGATDFQVRADSDRVIQILLNLLTNASKYGKPYKDIYLKTFNQGEYLVTEIKDTGPPILAEDKESIFRPYNLTRKKESGGLGLGLSICKKLVELHGGKIWLETQDTGNRFMFSLPLASKTEVS